LITTGAARDYAELRFMTHNDQFLEMKGIWQAFEKDGELNEHQRGRLEAIEARDGIFAEIDPGFWVAGAKADRADAEEPVEVDSPS
jgi:1,4-alpha-glucan branching enzyme